MTYSALFPLEHRIFTAVPACRRLVPLQCITDMTLPLVFVPLSTGYSLQFSRLVPLQCITDMTFSSCVRPFDPAQGIHYSWHVAVLYRYNVLLT